MQTNKTYWVYRHFDVLGVLLYVGMTRCPVKRRSEHRRKSQWWPRVDRIDMRRQRNRHAAQQAERVAVIREKPLFNKHHRPKDGRRDAAGL